MDVVYSQLTDFEAWIALAKEVEPLFGPMADDVTFQEALKAAISEKTAFCIRAAPDESDKTLIGGVVIDKASNEIAWLAVSERYRGKGYGRQLLRFAIGRLNPRESISVQTFDASVPEGKAARRLYLDVGFVDHQRGGRNPAGIPTMIMRLTGPDVCDSEKECVPIPPLRPLPNL